MDDRPIGVFDSGMGGLSVLRDLKSALPGEDFVYFGDNGNAPYGMRGAEDIRALSRRVAERLMEHSVKALVIACNTAASAAEEMLREKFPIPVVGIEPELIDAKARAGERRVLVFATEATLRQPRYIRARDRLCPDAVSIPAPELVLMVERGVLSGEEPERFFRGKLAPYPEGEIGAIVLGCTHFPFLKRAIRSVAPSVPLFDGNARLIRTLSTALAERGLLAGRAEGSHALMTSSDDPAVLARMRMLMEVNVG